MKLKNHGISTSNAEVTHISVNGVWLLVKGVEYFLPFERFSWFKNATLAQIQHVQLLHGFHLRWPDLDVDVEFDSLIHPEKYPLIYR